MADEDTEGLPAEDTAGSEAEAAAIEEELSAEGAGGEGPQGDGPAGEEPQDEYERHRGFFPWLASHAPWWGVSLAVHVLAILLVGLATWSTHDVASRGETVVETKLERRPEVAAESKLESKSEQILESKNDVPPTDPTSKEASNIFVPPEVMAKAVVGDHWETNNPDKEDTKSAFGNPDAHTFWSEQGSTDAAGGGGTGGLANSLDDVIGVGQGSVGKGGGWGGGEGTGTGIDRGSGHGSFGNRSGGGRQFMVKRHGGSKATEQSVDWALKWLADHQETDGHWDSKKYGSSSKFDTGLTGLALLAFLGAGHTEKVGIYKVNVKRAVEWLRSQQDVNGLVLAKGEAGHGCGYGHSIAGLALAEAAAMGRVKETTEAAQKALDHSLKDFCNWKDGWRYAPKQAGDLSVTGWFVMQCKSGKVAGLYMEADTFEKISKFIDHYEAKNKYGAGVSGYNYQGGGAHQACSAIGNLCRLFTGVKPETLRANVEGFVKADGLPSDWEAKVSSGLHGKTNLYYWYYGTLCTFQLDPDGKLGVWKPWNEAMKKTLCDNQRKDGDDKGSWDPVGALSGYYGRVGQTAFGALCLEVYYRYSPMYR